MATATDVYLRAWKDPQWESENLSKRPLRGLQSEIVSRIERFIYARRGGAMTVRLSRQVGKNEMAAVLHRRFLWRYHLSADPEIWIRTAPTYKPQIVNSKQRLKALLRCDRRWRVNHPMLAGKILHREEGYIWSVGAAQIRFLSSGKQSNVVGDTATVALDMDEAHKVDQKKFDEDFAPMAADRNAAMLLWGVAADGHDTMAYYRNHNIELGRPELNIQYPWWHWAEANPNYAAHVAHRIKVLGEDHPIFKTQYRLEDVSSQGTFLQPKQQRALFSGDHEKHMKPKPGARYQMVVDIAASNEEFNSDSIAEGDKHSEGDVETETDSSVIWIYEVSPILAPNGIFPIVRLVHCTWRTGQPLPDTEKEIDEQITYWNVERVTIDAVGVGRQIAEAMAIKYGNAEHGGIVLPYTASNASVSEDCFDLLARLNNGAVLMYRDDGSKQYQEFSRQVGWTKYSSSKGMMRLEKPGPRKHIDMVKGLTYIFRNNPVGGTSELYANEGDLSGMGDE